LKNNKKQMEDEIDNLLRGLLETYPDAKGVMFTSVEHPIQKRKGIFLEVLELYKDIPMMSMDDAYNTEFSFIITDKGTIITFFIKKLNFISVFVEGENPNKELALRMYESFREQFEEKLETLL
jgi:hypothetical protein